MRFVRLLAATAALACSVQAGAWTKATGTVSTNANGVAVIPLTQLGGRGHLYYNKFLWTSDLPAAISVQQDFDLTVNVQGHLLWKQKPRVYIPASTSTSHYTWVSDFGTGTDIGGKFYAPLAEYYDYTHTSSANYTASLIVKALPNSVLNYTLKNGAVPEPATWSLMILGLGGVGAVLRRRARHQAVVALAS